MLTSHELAIQQVTQPEDHHRVPRIRQSMLELYGAERTVSQAAQNRDRRLLGEQLQRAYPQLVLFAHSPLDSLPRNSRVSTDRPPAEHIPPTGPCSDYVNHPG